MIQNKVTFKNQPKLSADKVDEKFNQRRLALIPVIENYLSTSKYFNGDITVTFSHKGISSLVCFADSANEKKVLKVALSVTHSAGEAQFLKVWEAIGVKVPCVFDSGNFNDHPYVLMEFINAVSVGEAYTHDEMVKNSTYIEMGKVLRQMHEPKGEGYGMVVDGHGMHHMFSEWLESPDIKKRIDYVTENNLLPSVWNLFPVVLDVLIKHAEKDHSSFCHDDFGGSNMLATKPLTVFDPNPRFNNRYIDIGRTMIIYIANGLFPQQILEGYFAKENCDNKALYASMFLNIVMKAPYSHKKGCEDILKNWEDYLFQNKNILE